MKNDPIVKEVREAGKILADEADNDIRKFFSNLRKAQKRYDKQRLKKPEIAKSFSGRKKD